MNKKIALVFIFISLHILVFAQTFTERKQQYPVIANDGQRIITGFQPFNESDDQILANAIIWTVNEICKQGRDEMFDIKVLKKSFSFNVTLDYVTAGKSKYIFNCKANIRVADGKLVYTLYDIEYKTNSIMSSISSTTNLLDKLNPEKKPKQKEIIAAYQELASKMLNQMFDAIAENKAKPITHWSDIDIQRPLKGMNESECIIAFGKPGTVYEDNNNRVQWSYGLNFLLIFKQGIVETIIR